MQEKTDRASILVVEDESLLAKDLSFKLTDLGYEVASVAHTAEDAVKCASELNPDLILMDIRLSGDMDGIDAAVEIKKHLDIPIVYLTAYSDEVTLARAKITGPFGYILKPFDERDIRCSIEIALYKHNMDLELKAAQKEIRVLNGLLPICASCKKIRDDKGYWSQLELYIRDHSNAEFTHGYCPECAQDFLDRAKKITE